MAPLHDINGQDEKAGRKAPDPFVKTAFSPLIRRVLAVNLLALAILGGGLLYLNQFRNNLVASYTDQLIEQAEIIAGALGEAASSGAEAIDLDLAASRQILGRVLAEKRTRARLFAVDGPLMVDSRFLRGGVAVFPLDLPDEQKSYNQIALDMINGWLDKLALDQTIPAYEERAGQEARDYDEVMVALTGERAIAKSRLSNGDLMISVAVPVQRFRRVLGALMVSADTSGIRSIVRAERVSILRIFGLSIIVTLLMSFFLASTIARPIQRLAQAADHVRRGTGRSTELAKSANRKDEIGHLSQTVYEMTMALYAQIKAVESFAADVAHEIKNPLSSINSALETINRTNDPAVHDKLLAIIKDDVRRLDRLITDISDASRLDAELTSGKTEEVDMALLLGTLVDAYETTGKGNQVSIRFDNQCEKPPLIRGIEGRLGQVIGNLLDNALSFAPDNSEVSLTLRDAGDGIILTIDDEGPGLPPGAHKKIFARFYSERPDSEAFGTHSGLGLSISKQIIEAHHGQIEAVNRGLNGDHLPMDEDEMGDQPVAGARFIIKLPKI